LRIGFDGGFAYLTGTYGDFALASGIIPGPTIASIFNTLSNDYKRTQRGQFLPNSIQITSMPGQLVLSYDAACSPCTLKVTTDAAQLNPVNDVNTSLFASSDQDNRPGCLTNGIHHLCVVGKRTSEVDLLGGGHRSSRSLEAYSTVYISVGGGPVQSASTTNIPIGMTLGELPILNPPTVDETSRTKIIIDPQTGIRMKPLGLISDFIPNKYPGPVPSPTAGPYMSNAGYTRMCGTNLVGPGAGGYVCFYPSDLGVGGPNLLYWVQQDGTVHFLGAAAYLGAINNIDNNFYYTKSNIGDFKIYKGVLTSYADQPQGTFLNPGSGYTETIFSSQTPVDLVLAYDSTFPTYGGNDNGFVDVTSLGGTDYGVAYNSGTITFTSGLVGKTAVISGADYQVKTFTDSTHIVITTLNDGNSPTYITTGTHQTYWQHNGGFSAQGQYVIMTFQNHQQNNYGSVAVFNMGNFQPIGSGGTGSVIAAAPLSTGVGGAGGWCGVHNFQLMQESSSTLNVATVANLETHVMGGGDGYSSGPYKSTMVGNYTAGTTPTIQINGVPTNSAAIDSFLKDWSVSDEVALLDPSNGNSETIYIATHPDSTHLTFTTPLVNSYTNGSTIQGWCRDNALQNWLFLNDRHGTDTTNTNFVSNVNWPILHTPSGHDDWNFNVVINEIYNARIGPIETNLNISPNYSQTQSPVFAGLQPNGFGETFQYHPSIQASTGTAQDRTWFTDFPSYQFVSSGSSPNMSPVTGQLWRVNHPNASDWNPKVLPFYAVNGHNNMIDISGPSSTIGTTSADQWKVCLVVVAGECYAGSSPGDIFANLPSGNTGTCTANTGSNDVCIAAVPGHGQAASQIGNLTGTPTKRDRQLTMGFSTWRNVYAYATAKSLPDASWIQFGFQGTNCPTGASPPCQTSHVWLLKPPPYVNSDSLDRTTFLRPTVNIISPGGSVVTAVVEFGYAESTAVGATATTHYCTSRAEACWAVNSLTTDANPFAYPSENPTKTNCSSTCTIQVPVLPNHIAYYQVKFYDSSGTFVSNGESGVLAEATKVANL
jgi:hypothetical protein